MSQKKLFIHIGTQKTGSTTIQSVLSQNKRLLTRENICYLGRFAKLAREIRAIDDHHPKYVNQFRDEFESKLNDRKNKNAQTFIISNEKFSGDKMISHNNASTIAHFLNEVFEPYNFDIKIIVFLRRQDSYIESTYIQKIYSSYTKSFQDFSNEVDLYSFCWDEFVDCYADVFGFENIFPQLFDKKYLTEDNTLIHTFGKVVGSEYLQNFQKLINKNKGFSRASMEIMKIANRSFAKRDRRQIRSVLREFDPQGKKPVFLTNQERKKLLDHYQKSNQRLAHQYFKNLPEPLFSIPTYPDKYEVIEDEKLDVDTAVVTLCTSILGLSNELKTAKNEANSSKRSLNKVYFYFKKRLRTIVSTLLSFSKSSPG